jgi:hypothetical protein
MAHAASDWDAIGWDWKMIDAIFKPVRTHRPFASVQGMLCAMVVTIFFACAFMLSECSPTVTSPLGDVTQGGDGYPREPSSATTSWYQNSGGALDRTGIACEFEVPLDVGNSPCFEVTWRCNKEALNSPSTWPERRVIIPGIPHPDKHIIRGGTFMVEHQDRRVSSLLVRSDQPLIGVITKEKGREVVRYFAEEELADATISTNVTQAALKAIGAWSDLPWDEMESALDRIRHESRPTPPITKLWGGFF